MKLILDFSSYYLGLPIVHSELSGVVICSTWILSFYLILFPCRVFFLYLFIYLFRIAQSWPQVFWALTPSVKLEKSLLHYAIKALTTWFSSVGNQRRWLKNLLTPLKSLMTCLIWTRLMYSIHESCTFFAVKSVQIVRSLLNPEQRM